MAKGKSRKGGKGKRPTSRIPAGKPPKAKKPVARKVAAKKKALLAKPAVPPAPRRPVKSRPSVVRTPAPRLAPHKIAVVSRNIYERDLDRTPANYAPLTPLQFIERSASVYPDDVALIHGQRRQSWAETYQRCRRLASALEKVGIGLGDTVGVMAPQIPEMYQAHFARPMSRRRPHSLNPRPDAGVIRLLPRH